METQLPRLQELATAIKKRFLAMYKNANAGHIGASLSCADILTFICFDWMEDTDELILSKGHAAAALYSVMAQKGWLTEEEISTFYKNDTYLAAHPPANKIKKIPFATGSLGHGLSLAAGMGLANRLKDSAKKIFCVTSDGELNEGSIWEAAMTIAHHRLQNVTWFIDKNNLQGFGTTEEVMNMGALDKKLSAFGFDVLTVDGHDFGQLHAIKEYYHNATQPLAIVCNTIKGKDWAAHENTLDSHYLPFKENQYEEIIDKISRQQ